MPRRVTLQVPSGTDIPDFYTNATPDEIATALQLGANLYSTMRSLRLQEANTAVAAMEEEKAAEIERIQAAAATAQERLTQEIQAAREARTLAQQTHQEQLNKLYTQHSSAVEEERASAIRTTKATYESQMARHQEHIASLQSRLQLVEETRTAEVKRAEERAEERTRTAMQLVLEEKQRGIERLERERDKLTAVVEKNTEELRTLASSIVVRKTKSSKEKGDDFEATFKGQLVATYGTCPGFAVETTASNGHGHAADLLMKLDDKSILWEVKNYDAPVPTKEVEKFHRDMTENPTISIGVMVSRATHITGKNNAGPKFIEFMNDRMMIYIHNYDTLPETTLHDLMLVFKLYWHASRNFESQESIESAIRSLEKLRADAATARTAWKHHKIQNEAMVRWMTEQVEGAEERLQHALRSLQGTVSTTALDIPPGIFRDVTGEAKSLEYIRCILEIAEPSKGISTSCVLNDVAHLVAEKLKVGRDTVRGHIRGLLLDDAYIPPKGKNPARVAGLALKNEFTVS